LKILESDTLDEPRISVIIPSHNSESTIQRCIKSLISQSYPRKKFEIIVVDDGSKDNSVNLAKTAGADYVIQTNPCSISIARNTGVKNSKGMLLAFIDSDCETQDDWLKTIDKELKESQVVGGVVKNGNPHSNVAWAEYFTEFGGFHEKRKRDYTVLLPGCQIACTREAFQKSGGFLDGKFSEDILFCMSLKEAGIKPIFIPELQILHLCRTDLENVLSNSTKLGKFFVRTRRLSSTLSYRFLIKTRWLIPLIFVGKILKCMSYAVAAKKSTKFICATPYIIICVSSFCKGVWKELSK